MDNGEWNLVNETPEQIPAWYNYWGMNDADSIDATIWDDDEDSLKGPVIFDPFLADHNVGLEEYNALRSRGHVLGELNVFPNPFRNQVSILFTLRRPSAVRAQIIDPTGKVVHTLLAGQYHQAGQLHLQWDGSVQGGRMTVPGSYVVTIEAGNDMAARSIIFLR
jgi:hypothetical protein